jgi:thiopeptide-type bacteriocin biosynthesis protein
MRARLARLGEVTLEATLARALDALARGELARGAAALVELPGAAGVDVQAVLVHRPRRRPTLARGVVDRAAALAPLLFRLQDALAPPASERLAQPALDEALAAVTELHGAGALDLGALAAGDYGVSVQPEDDVEADRAPGVPAGVLSVLVDALLTAARAGRREAALDVDALTRALDGVGPAAPPTCELFLAPVAAPPGAREGTGWLLGLHAPAGASWGRFMAALGAPLAAALDALAAAERAARPDQQTLDVSFAPSPALADLCAHGRARPRVLALSEWSDAPDGDLTLGDLTLGDLQLVADPAAEEPLALRVRRDRTPVVPSPLARVRSTTAPAGPIRLLCGWSLYRQHAPWALGLGPLAALERVPRLVLDGFVVAPASWRLPAAARPDAHARARLRRWRRAAGVPRFVQVGEEDRLLVVDLDGAGAAADLAGHARVWEIWPPLGATVDRDGRRVEAVVALVRRPDLEDADADARAARATVTAGPVAPPRLSRPPTAWRTFKVFGAREHQDALLLEALRPALAAARRAREIDAWFFQRYVDGPGRRHHLRVRARAATPRGRAAFEARLEAALAPARAAGAVVAIEAGDYHPERARFGDALAAVHPIFQSDSELACALLDEEARGDDAPDRLAQVVRSLDALARGLGLDLEARRALARARRAAEEGDAFDAETRAEADGEFRARGRVLRAHLGAPGAGAAARALEAHAARTARATKALPPAARAALAPPLLHLACVRLAGPDRDLERRAYTFWERTLEGLRASARPSGRDRDARAR